MGCAGSTQSQADGKIKSILFCWIGEKRNRFFLSEIGERNPSCVISMLEAWNVPFFLP